MTRLVLPDDANSLAIYNQRMNAALPPAQIADQIPDQIPDQIRARPLQALPDHLISQIAAAEVGVGLAIVLLIFRNRADIDLDELDLMKG